MLIKKVFFSFLLFHVGRISIDHVSAGVCFFIFPAVPFRRFFLIMSLLVCACIQICIFSR